MTLSFVNLITLPKRYLLLWSFVIIGLFVFLLCTFFPPRWETNDDVAMSMLAHGYGFSLFGSPKILFSNVIWGSFVRAIPTINGILGYSVATLAVLIAVGCVVLYSFLRFGFGGIASLSVLGVVLTGPVIFPQFTINAGLLFIGALLCWRMYAQENNLRVLFVGCCFAFLSYLVRGHQFLLMFLVAFPLLSWGGILRRRSAKIAVLILFLLIALSAVVNKKAYQGEEWKSFNELNPARAAFTDYGAGKLLKKHPDIMKNHGYSANDIDLIGNWFFVDSNIANPKILNSLLSDLGPLSTQANSLTNALSGVQALWHPRLLISLLTALLLFILMPSWKVAASWVLGILAVFLMGLFGRPGVLHVYVPLVSLLLIAPFLVGKISGWRQYFVSGILFVATIANAAYIFSESRKLNFNDRNLLADLTVFPNTPVVVWGDTFPYEAVYPVLGASSAAMSYRHYGFGTSTLAPYTVAYEEQKAGRGFTDIFTKNGGVPVMAHPVYLEMLGIYCQERLNGKMNKLSNQKFGAAEVHFVRCDVKP